MTNKTTGSDQPVRGQPTAGPAGPGLVPTDPECPAKAPSAEAPPAAERPGSDAKSQAKAAAPQEAAAADRPATGTDAKAKRLLEATLAQARQGDLTCLPQLHQILDAHPELWQQQGDLAAVSERSWIKLIASKNLLMAESVIRRLKATREELGGSSRLEKLIVERIVSASLQVEYAQLAVSTGTGDGLQVRQFRLKQQESAEKRFDAACRSLALVRRLLGGVELHIQHTHKIESPAGPEAPVGPGAATTPETAAAPIPDERREWMFGEPTAAKVEAGRV